MSKLIAVIPARGGSKRIPKKNIKFFEGVPLIVYSIKAAQESKLFDKIIVSTDDAEIKRIALDYGAEVPFVRPKELSDDYVGTAEVIKHALDFLKKSGEEFDYLCTIYATAPLLDSKYLISGYKKLKTSSAINSFSCTSMPFPIQRTFKIDKNDRCEMFNPEHYLTRSQDLEEAYQDAGQFYWTKLNETSSEIMFGKDSIPIILPKHLVCDIDTQDDWTRAEYMYKAINHKKKNQTLENIKELKLGFNLEKSYKNILIRANSSSLIGLGHIKRDLVLVEKFKNSNITFAVQDLEGNINKEIIKKDYKFHILKNNDVKELITLSNKKKIDLLIIDSYEIDYFY
ncbi:MAG: pseudaminic acid cytidylyltransferase, partial [Campylobacteraceae bacterium]|nr:pseudaminic acid cytidylyltransferase [Campylobacteraceae bacterium]